MSPPRRRRRRRGRGEATETPKRAEGQPTEARREPGTRSRSRGRRRRGATGRRSGSPLLSEDLVRALPKERPATLSGPPDGQTLENLIGDLQSEWGVPQYPQEYRITIKVADERDVRPDRPAATEPDGQSSDPSPAPGAPKRERAPAAPRVASSGTVEREAAPKRRRGRRRRRRGKDPDGGSNGSAPTEESRPPTAEGPPPEG